MAESAFAFAAPESPGFLLWQTTVVWQRQIKEALEPFEISHAQFVILAILLWSQEAETEPNQTLIARQSKLDKMTVSTSLKKLGVKRYVRRTESDRDPRANSVRLTDRGKQLATKLVPIVEGIDKTFFGVLTPTRQRELVTTLASLLREERG
ncbi:MAG TPA: MarR family winged helix-turn-helix transcriptional regulator [bacterium]|nr:MarR family winged helix-turn-helix transcriptional regulator [bacterium]